MRIVVTALLFFFLLIFNYMGAVGRMTSTNQINGMPEFNLGRVSERERKAVEKGTHRRLAFIQSLIAALIYSGVLYFILGLFIS